MEHFSPVSASIGGALIGLSAALLWLGNGRIAGISGIFGQLLPPASTVVWRLVFLVALIGGTFLAAYLFPALGNAPQLAAPPSWFTAGAPLWIAVSMKCTPRAPSWTVGKSVSNSPGCSPAIRAAIVRATFR